MEQKIPCTRLAGNLVSSASITSRKITLSGANLQCVTTNKFTLRILSGARYHHGQRRWSGAFPAPVRSNKGLARPES